MPMIGMELRCAPKKAASADPTEHDYVKNSRMLILDDAWDRISSRGIQNKAHARSSRASRRYTEIKLPYQMPIEIISLAYFERSDLHNPGFIANERQSRMPSRK